MEATEKIYLAILNITSFCGQCCDAEHLYGHLYLSKRDDVTIDSVTDWNVKYLGEGIEIKRPLTLELAKALDEKDGGSSYKRSLRIMEEDTEFAKENPDYGMTNRFDTFEQVVNAGIAKWRELDINCPFISLYEGDKYYKNSYEPSETVILQYEK